MSSSEIFQVCNQLANAGKEPSVALIKSNLTKRVPLPEIISGLQQWKNNPNAPQPQLTLPEEKSAKDLSSRVANLERLVTELTAEIKSLKEQR